VAESWHCIAVGFQLISTGDFDMITDIAVIIRILVSFLLGYVFRSEH
jgi:hypothetical protein